MLLTLSLSHSEFTNNPTCVLIYRNIYCNLTFYCVLYVYVYRKKHILNQNFIQYFIYMYTIYVCPICITRTICRIRVIIVKYLNTHTHSTTQTLTQLLVLSQLLSVDFLPPYILRFVILTYLCQFRNTILVNQRKR